MSTPPTDAARTRALEEGKRLFVQTTQGLGLRGVFEVLRENLLDETLVCSASGIQLIAINQTSNAMVSLQMPASNFETYHCSRKTLIGLCMSNVTRLFKGVTSHDIVTLEMLETDDTTLIVRIESPDRVTQFSLRLLDLPERVVDLPAKRFSSVLSLAAADLQKLISNMSQLAHTVQFRRVAQGVEMHAYGDFVEQTTTLIERDQSAIVIKQDAGADADECSDFGAYSLKALAIFCKASSVASTVDLHLKADLLVLAYQVPPPPRRAPRTTRRGGAPPPLRAERSSSTCSRTPVRTRAPRAPCRRGAPPRGRRSPTWAGSRFCSARSPRNDPTGEPGRRRAEAAPRCVSSLPRACPVDVPHRQPGAEPSNLPVVQGCSDYGTGTWWPS